MLVTSAAIGSDGDMDVWVALARVLHDFKAVVAQRGLAKTSAETDIQQISKDGRRESFLEPLEGHGLQIIQPLADGSGTLRAGRIAQGGEAHRYVADGGSVP